MKELLEEAKSQLAEVLELVAEDLKGVKTGRAKPQLVEDLEVEAYQTKMTLKELASISVADPHTLLVSPWDKSVIEAIEKAVNASDLHLHAQVANETIRIKIPALTEETRKDLVKLVQQKLESGRRLLRQVRNESKKKIEDLKGGAGVSEDDIHQWLENLQELVDQFLEKIEMLGKKKEEELLKI